jgi:predicted transposase YbfD/YdcC
MIEVEAQGANLEVANLAWNIPVADICIGVDKIVGHFKSLKDPRSPVNRLHPLTSVVVISIMAILAGANGPTAIALWANDKKTFLERVLDLPNGVPCKDVFHRVLCRLKPEAFQECFGNWLWSLRQTAEGRSDIKRPTFPIDGKSDRRSHDRKKGLGPLHSVSLWAADYGLSLGQVACAEKSNEITAIPELLKLIDIEGAIITIDAMGTQKAIAAQIVDQKADYVLALKGNQETLHQEVIDYIEEQSKNDFADVAVRRKTTTEKGHGRQETRYYYHMPAPAHMLATGLWKGLKSIGMVVSVCIRNGKETIETRYYISSLAVGVNQFAHAVRSHWAIENTCHWTLDMVFRADESRTRNPYARTNLAWLNRLALSLLKQHPKEDSIAMKRRSCGWNDDFMLEVLTGIIG